MIKFLWWELNLEELFIWSCIQFPLYYVVHWWILILMPVCGLFGAIGGSKEGIKAIRRFGIPLVCGVAIYLVQGLCIPMLVACAVSAVVISLGYGENSILYKIWKFCPVEAVRTFAIRTTTYVLYFITYMAAVPFVR